MGTDTIATKLVIQIMPLLMREFQIKVDPQLLFADRIYADSVIELAGTASNERLRTYAALLRDRLRALAAGPIGAARSSSVDFALDAAPSPTPTPASHHNAGIVSPAPAAGSPPGTEAPAAPATLPGSSKYIRSLR